MARCLAPLLSVRDTQAVHIVRLESEHPWRSHPEVVDWIAPLIAAACDKVKASRSVRELAFGFILDSARGYYFDSSDLGGPTVTLGVSASHEAGATYVAFSEQAVAIDCCASERADEVRSGGRLAFSTGEFAMLERERSLVHGWAAVECLCKLWGAGILRPSARPMLLTARPMTAEGTEFGSARDIARGRSGRDVCVWATKTRPT